MKPMPRIPRKIRIVLIHGSTWKKLPKNFKKEKEGISVNPFVEGYGFAETDKRVGAGVRAGVKIEF